MPTLADAQRVLQMALVRAYGAQALASPLPASNRRSAGAAQPLPPQQHSEAGAGAGADAGAAPHHDEEEAKRAEPAVEQALAPASASDDRWKPYLWKESGARAWHRSHPTQPNPLPSVDR